MKIECPHCEELNKIDFSENIKCSKCDENFKGYRFKKYSRLAISASSALAVGAVSGYGLNETLETERYPLEVEYSIVDTCVNSSGNSMSVSWYKNKRDICLCALDSTMSDISYSSYKSDNSEFVSAFTYNVEKCD